MGAGGGARGGVVPGPPSLHQPILACNGNGLNISDSTYMYCNRVLLHNGGFCNGCITKRILLLQAFHSQENQHYADYDKNITFFINLIFYHREIVTLDHYMTLSLSYSDQTPFCDAAIAKSTVLYSSTVVGRRGLRRLRTALQSP